MKIGIAKSLAKGVIKAPPSKSYGHRLLIASFLAGGGKVIGLESSMDIEATKACLSALSSNEEGVVLPCNESGSTLRFLIPVALTKKKEANFVGSPRLFQRGLGPYERIFAEQGIDYSLSCEGLYVKGSLKPGEFRLDGGVSSQFFTGLLFALPLLEGDSSIVIEGGLESAPYIEMTLDVLSRYGVKVERKEDGFLIRGRQNYANVDEKVEGDESNAAFLHAFNLLGGEVRVTGLNPNSIQGDKVHGDFFALLEKGHPTIDLSNAIDLGPICFGLAAILNGGKFVNIRRLRIKESDRVKEMAKICWDFGAITIENENEIEIFPSKDKSPLGEIVVPNDHRLVMTTAVMLSTRGGVILGAEAVRKSYPNFFEDISKLGIEVIRYED